VNGDMTVYPSPFRLSVSKDK
jgi:hypothetical protein